MDIPQFLENCAQATSDVSKSQSVLNKPVPRKVSSSSAGHKIKKDTMNISLVRRAIPAIRTWRLSLSGIKGGVGGGFEDILSHRTAEETQRPSIIAYGDQAFQVNNTLVRQSVILLPNSFLLWNARTFEDISVKTLSVFATLYPTPEILFVGCGDRLPKPLPAEITTYFRSRGIVVEASSTMNAASTFNLLSSEGRNVVAALLTLQPITSDFSGLD